MCYDIKLNIIHLLSNTSTASTFLGKLILFPLRVPGEPKEPWRCVGRLVAGRQREEGVAAAKVKSPKTKWFPSSLKDIQRASPLERVLSHGLVQGPSGRGDMENWARKPREERAPPREKDRASWKLSEVTRAGAVAGRRHKDGQTPPTDSVVAAWPSSSHLTGLIATLAGAGVAVALLADCQPSLGA